MSNLPLWLEDALVRLGLREPVTSKPISIPEPPRSRSPDLPWMAIAKSRIGLSEITGPKHNPNVVNLWTEGKAGKVKDDETPWCSAFVSAILEAATVVSARTGWARGYLKWGTKLAGPAYGCIAVFKRGPKTGHVGFIVGKDKDGNLMVLGGNQKNMVCIEPLAADRAIGFRWPPTYTHSLPSQTGLVSLPLLSSDGSVSTNEA